ncbi:hypothetical protein HCB95_02785 [Streptococcus suis]|uniref:hypothetical protein n=1 Tax=Streptococcus suis TaxID=1307 RepID=UPI0006B6390D|nr:hypothetical protein [Streptococcus suis]KPA55990.1 hypothetical protein XK24_08875 [Streptococcus suis]MCK3822596.1 hypothetical protein [Streptococcus suis]MCK3956134.1 hypothetical protein [Streptococcus suis]MCK4039127.1 hypothetical protein [Streptococcus suis]MCK4046048.1 hypothetical protein [Streptococcus suis]
MQKEKMTVEEFLQLKKDAQVSLILFIVFGLVLFSSMFYITVIGARTQMYNSLVTMVFLSVLMSAVGPYVFSKNILEKKQPELKQYSTEGYSVSSAFLKRVFLVYSVAIIVVVFGFASAYATRVETILPDDTLPSLEQKSIIEQKLEGNSNE